MDIRHLPQLRAAAEARLAHWPTTEPFRSDTELLHELRIHQIELEMQNEALQDAQSALLESRDRFVDLFEFSPLGYLTLNERGLITEVNQAGAALLGMARKDLLALPLVRFFSPEDADRWHMHLVATLNASERRSGELTLLRGGGVRVHVRVDSVRLNGMGRTPALLVVLSDVTERKLAMADLLAAKTAVESASMAKSRFLAAASHDLRQPAQAISLFTEALAKTRLDPEQQRICECLAESTRALRDLLNTLLDVSRLDAGVVQSSPHAVSLDTLVREIDALASSLVAGKALRFKLCFPYGERALMTDSRLLMMMLANIIGNAAKYTLRGGILVAIRRRGDLALIQVWDTGIGIAPEHLNSIFEDYFQVDNPARDHAKGLGLGLSNAQRIAKLLNTQIHCRSQRHKGSVFEFFVPWASEH